MLSVALALISLTYADVIADPDSFVRELHKDIRDIRFEYEGTCSEFDQSTKRMPETRSFSGSVIFRNDGSLKLDLIDHFDVPETGQKFLHRISKSYFLEIEQHYEEQNGKGGLSTGEKGRTPNLFFTGSPMNLFPLPNLRLTAKYPKKSMIHEGTREVDGHLCEVVSFLMGPGYEKNVVTDKMIVDRYFLDLNRGAMPIRVETWRNGEMIEKTSDIVLEKFEAEDKKSIWLPVSARHESLTTARDREQIPELKLGAPYRVETFVILRGSVRLNSGVKDDQFVLRFPDGALITEKSVNTRRQARTKATLPPPINLKEAQSELEAKLKEGEETRTEIVATSVARNTSSNPWTFALLGIGLTSMFLIVFLKLRGQS